MDTKALEAIDITLSVHVGSATMPMHQFLRLGRGAIIELDKKSQDELLVLANDKPFAKGHVLVNSNVEHQDEQIGGVAVQINTLLSSKQ